MSDLRAYIANCLISGDEFSINENTKIRDTITFNINDRSFILKQKADVITGSIQQFTGQFCKTSDIIVRDVIQGDVEEVLTSIERICWLLSFAGVSHVINYGYNYPDQSFHGKQYSVSGTAEYFRPAINIQDGALVKSFIEQTYSKFKAFETSRKLKEAIHYLLQAENKGLPSECRLTLIFVLLENLKHSYAHYMKISYKEGRFRKDDNKAYSFKELLEKMFNSVDMSPDLDDVKQLRNEIIHSGLCDLGFKDQRAMYEKIHDIVREYILRLLNYKGQYYAYSLDNGIKTIA